MHGGLDHKINLRGGGSGENYVFFRGGGQILNGIPQSKSTLHPETELVSQFRITYKYFLKYTNIEY